MRLSSRCQGVTKSVIQNKIAARLKNFNKIKAKDVDPAKKLESMLSSVYIQNGSFKAYNNTRENIEQTKEKQAQGAEKEDIFLPFKSDLTQVQMVDSKKQTEDSYIGKHDRGFYYKNGMLCDEYVEGLASSIVDEEMNEIPYVYRNVDGAVERIDFLDPKQTPMRKKKPKNSPKVEEDEEGEEEDVNVFYGNVDLDYKPEIDVNCVGCGATFHCQDPGLPGFLPVELLYRLESKKKRIPKYETNLRCRRCYMLKKYNFLLNVNVSQVDYRAIMGHLKLREDILVLLVVDMTDIRGSILSQLPALIGTGKNVMVIGNKVDLLPPDARPGYFKKFKEILNYEIERAGLKDRFRITRTELISAKTGFGVEDLITSIFMEWVNIKGHLRSDIYLVGATNAGKSTLFNTFIQSDLCRVRAQDLVERVTTSIWPGTTLSLLKFPIMNPSTRKLELRRRRLLSQMNWKWRETQLQRQMFKETGETKYLSLTGIMGNTFKEEEKNSQPLSNEELQERLDKDFAESEEDKTEKPRIRLHGEVFKNNFWCYDTPGTVNPNQILDLLTLEELVNVIPKSLIVPRSVVLQEEWSLLVGGLGRIDVIHVEESAHTENRPVFMTVFASNSIKLEALLTSEVDEFLKENQGTMGVPLGSEQRMAMLPEMKSQEFNVKSANPRFLRASTDILLSSLGWVSVSSIHNTTVRAFTPDGRGLGTRPAMLPYTASMRGRRISGTRLFAPKITLPTDK
ncbi:unnamed protein product [Bursaphelenchus okinawaensis]|uniref:G domain-containing protein n=1 Tax=Bursaphelenchus okinawaensis TaxID=465554 RepID=A0A811KAZ0_9BILA|nr:unnamed protein product [Bursaphelenchus okinawaensis]CAG9095095.1 unnamed protein product [Bursaphelenchus okinawaensis]